MKIALSSDSSIDLTSELLNKYKIDILPFTITMGEQTFLDGEIDADKIFEYVDKSGNIPKTSAVNEFQFEEHFNKLLKEYDAIIHISISSFASCAYQNAVSASKKFKNVYVVDSKNICTGVALCAIYARKLIDDGLLPEEIVEKVNIKSNYVFTNFITDKLDYLHKGGRVNGILYLASNLLKIHPQIYMKGGKTFSGTKYRGELKSVYDKYFNEIFISHPNPELEIGFVSYTSASNELIEKAVEVMKKKGFKQVYVTRTGATVTCHCGKNCLGCLFVDSDNNE